ncbi:flagellar hook-basal body complex protein [Paralimibaculum aggregatum]|uniref:Flagellar hook-basal body complex protein n=1 Tax=Paralimibaculum aggregatum TaxID=3036245 RepID=A0ABQ6LK62_9RHOB|nr:flagellar hook-basal body complex protein [Limibaculum sp. NKW23]GMG83642.1 flagellar hook-basal body complex protein [Limibaculum sp. NKW23]
MDDSFYYLAVNRQSGLKAEMATIANNIANLDTPGFRREGMIFSEYVVAAERGDSVSMADLDARFASDRPGRQSITAGALDIAIEGEGFFVVEDPLGLRLTRAGAFQRSEEGLLVTSAGDTVLDAGLAPVFVPPEGEIAIASDGTVSVDGQEQARIGIFTGPQEALTRSGDTGFLVPAEAITAVEAPKLRQGALEGSNVDPVLEIARMIEVSRAYEQAQQLIQDEDDRIREAIDRLGQPV